MAGEGAVAAAELAKEVIKLMKEGYDRNEAERMAHDRFMDRYNRQRDARADREARDDQRYWDRINRQYRVTFDPAELSQGEPGEDDPPASDLSPDRVVRALLDGYPGVDIGTVQAVYPAFARTHLIAAGDPGGSTRFAVAVGALALLLEALQTVPGAK